MLLSHAIVVRLTVVLIASPRNAPRLEEALKTLMRPVRRHAGCLGCSAWIGPDSTVHYEEDWATEMQIRDRVASEPFVQLLSVIEASEARPRVQFDFVTLTRGLDYVEEVRTGRESPRSAGSTGES